jgi:glycosyltransferase involved in cell wall biosynthesis
MRGARSRIVVVTWDLAHNGASTAFMLADLLRREHTVEIAGPTFLGPEIWAPIRNTGIPIRSFPGTHLPQFVEDAERFVTDVEADVICACKPRFPTLLLASLLKDQCDAPVILHVDDLELGLVDGTAATSLAELEVTRDLDPAAFTNPAGLAWTSACEEMIAGADAITVSGEALRRRYGGAVLGQPRDETQFNPTLVDRGSARAALGYGDEDRVVLFLGSPRPHKGIVELAAAVAEIDDRHIKLCVIGTFTDARLRAEVAAVAPDRIQLIDYRAVSEVPRLTAIGDLVCLPQDPSVDFVAYQTPMKLTEALAMEVPVIARETPSLNPYIRAGVIAPIGDAPLSARIRELLEEPQGVREMVRRGREHFLTHLSYTAALTTINRVLAGLLDAPPPMPDSWEQACELASSLVERPHG